LCKQSTAMRIISDEYALRTPWSGPYQAACLVAGWGDGSVGGVVQVGGAALPWLVASLAQVSISACFRAHLVHSGHTV
jgi:hypothetical protein